MSARPCCHSWQHMRARACTALGEAGWASEAMAACSTGGVAAKGQKGEATPSKPSSSSAGYEGLNNSGPGGDTLRMQGSSGPRLPVPLPSALCQPALALTSLSVVCEKKRAPSLSATRSAMYGTICRRHRRRRRRCRAQVQGGGSSRGWLIRDEPCRQQWQAAMVAGRSRAAKGSQGQPRAGTADTHNNIKMPAHLLSQESHLGGRPQLDELEQHKHAAAAREGRK